MVQRPNIQQRSWSRQEPLSDHEFRAGGLHLELNIILYLDKSSLCTLCKNLNNSTFLAHPTSESCPPLFSLTGFSQLNLPEGTVPTNTEKKCSYPYGY